MQANAHIKAMPDLDGIDAGFAWHDPSGILCLPRVFPLLAEAGLSARDKAA